MGDGSGESPSPIFHRWDMKITKTPVEKWTITDVERMDLINVTFEDFKPGHGKMTIDSYGDAWSAYWGAMASENIKQFVSTASTSYLVGKLKIGIKSTIPNEDGDSIAEHMQKEIIRQRVAGDIDRERARELWDDYTLCVDSGISNNSDGLYAVFGVEWWEYGIPEEDNPEYMHLTRIVDVIKDAILEDQKVTA